MLAYALMWYIGMQISAPTWYYFVLVILFCMKIAQWGLDMYKLGAK